jgi:hypothetical protein
MCSSNCATCSLTATNCLSCTLGISGLQLYLFTDNKCYSTCPFGFFGQLGSNTNNTCWACDISCQGCIGSALSCINCSSNYSRIIGSTACTQNCGIGYYP